MVLVYAGDTAANSTASRVLVGSTGPTFQQPSGHITPPPSPRNGGVSSSDDEPLTSRVPPATARKKAVPARRKKGKRKVPQVVAESEEEGPVRRDSKYYPYDGTIKPSNFSWEITKANEHLPDVVFDVVARDLHAEPLVLRVAMGNELGDKKKQQHAQGICDMHMARSTAACTKWRNYMKELIGVGKGDMVGVKVSIRPFQATQKWSMMVG